MPEIIADLETTVMSEQGDEYYVDVVAEQLPDGSWEAWLEFVPPADDQDILVTGTETTQSTREDVARWAEILTRVYLEGAFGRAVLVTGSRRAERRYDTAVADAVALDPFEMLQALGKEGLRRRLHMLTRPELLHVIRYFDLNPAEKSLTRLSHFQLATFIVTAVEVQTAQRRR